MLKIAQTFFIIAIYWAASHGNAEAFEFKSLSNGDVVVAGSLLQVEIDPGDIPPLFGVLFSISRGIAKPKLDSLPPFKWSFEIPKHYYGPLTLWAVGRRYYPIANPPRTSVTLFVIAPAITMVAPRIDNPTAQD